MTYLDLLKKSGASTSQEALVKRARRLARKQGLILCVSRMEFGELGNFYLVNPAGEIIECGFDRIETVLEWLIGEIK